MVQEITIKSLTPDGDKALQKMIKDDLDERVYNLKSDRKKYKKLLEVMTKVLNKNPLTYSIRFAEKSSLRNVETATVLGFTINTMIMNGCSQTDFEIGVLE